MEEQLVSKSFPDNKGNHLLVALYFYGRRYKEEVLNIPSEYSATEIADISIEKADMDRGLAYTAFVAMNQWLLERIREHPNAVFTFICSTDPFENNSGEEIKDGAEAQDYRWRLFNRLYDRVSAIHKDLKLNIQDIVVGPEGYESHARAFYPDIHQPIIHIITANLTEKYT